VGGGVGGKSTGFTHPERSKIMNSSAFSCGESAVRVEQQLGNDVIVVPVVPPPTLTGSPGKSVVAASVTCRAV
jgi:hypothetical protein